MMAQPCHPTPQRHAADRDMRRLTHWPRRMPLISFNNILSLRIGTIWFPTSKRHNGPFRWYFATFHFPHISFCCPTTRFIFSSISLHWLLWWCVYTYALFIRGGAMLAYFAQGIDIDCQYYFLSIYFAHRQPMRRPYIHTICIMLNIRWCCKILMI